MIANVYRLKLGVLQEYCQGILNFKTNLEADNAIQPFVYMFFFGTIVPPQHSLTQIAVKKCKC